MRKERVIWSDPTWWSQAEVEGFQADLIESGDMDKDADEYDLYNRMWEINNEYLDDEKMNLDQDTGMIVAFADIGLWNGRVEGYKEFEYNLNNIFDLYDCDYNKWYSDGYNIRWVGVHHDGRNYCVFREIRRDLTNAQIDRFERKLADGTLTDRDVRRYTKSLLPRVKAVYGWR